MRIIKSLDEIPNISYPVLTQGTFDGVHLGHKELIKQINAFARKKNGESILLTYHPHPRLFLQPNNNHLTLLNTLEEKIDRLEKAGIQNLIILPFNKAMAGLSPDDFIQSILIDRIKIKQMQSSSRLVSGNDDMYKKLELKLAKHKSQEFAIV